MSKDHWVNPQIVDALAVSRQAAMEADEIRINGAGQACRSVAQSMAMAVQDATDNLRNVSQICTTATGIALARLLETNNESYQQALRTTAHVNDRAVERFKTIGIHAVGMLNGAVKEKTGGVS